MDDRVLLLPAGTLVNMGGVYVFVSAVIGPFIDFVVRIGLPMIWYSEKCFPKGNPRAVKNFLIAEEAPSRFRKSIIGPAYFAVGVDTVFSWLS